MTCRLLRNIKHTCEYNPGGIAEILLLDIRDFISYKFADDKLYNECYVDLINTYSPPVELDVVNECSCTSTEENGIYTQELSTFIRSMDAGKTAELLLASNNKYVVVYINPQGRAFTFGSDGGASLSFTQQSGQSGEAEGYSITIRKRSIYPLFEIDPDFINIQEKIKVIGTEDNRVIMSENELSAFSIQK